MHNPELPPRPDTMSPEEWEWCITEIERILGTLKHKIDALQDMSPLTAVVDLVILEDGIRPARTRFVLPA